MVVKRGPVRDSGYDQAASYSHGAGIFVSNPASNPVVFSGAHLSPWWGGRVIAVPADIDPAQKFEMHHAAGSYLVTAFFASQPGPTDVRFEEDRRVFVSQARLGIDPGPGAYLAGQDWVALTLAQAPSPPSGWPGTLLPPDEAPESFISLGPAIAPSEFDEPADWGEADEEPRWLAIEDLPFHGGGVMSRHRPRR